MIRVTVHQAKRIMDWAAAIIIVAGAVVIYWATPRLQGAPAQPATPPACATEDGGPIPCVWDGPNRGNHRGGRVTITKAP